MTKKNSLNPLQISVVDDSVELINEVLGIPSDRVEDLKDSMFDIYKKCVIQPKYYASNAISEISSLCKTPAELGYFCYMLGKNMERSNRKLQSLQGGLMAELMNL